MGRKTPDPPEEVGCPLWMVTFGDAVSLLVTFFVMLVSFADFEEHSLQNMVGALKGGLRAVPLPMATTVAGSSSDSDEDEEKTTSVVGKEVAVGNLYTNDEILKKEPKKNIIRSESPDYYLHLLENGVSLVIKCNAVFQRGTATLISPDHEVWDTASELMSAVHNELRIAVTLPEHIMVRMDGYKTAWGLGIEQSITVEDYLTNLNDGNPRQISTSVRVVEHMTQDIGIEGIVEIRYIGMTEIKMKGMPHKILRGKWRDVEEESDGGGDDG